MCVCVLQPANPHYFHAIFEINNAGQHRATESSSFHAVMKMANQPAGKNASSTILWHPGQLPLKSKTSHTNLKEAKLLQAYALLVSVSLKDLSVVTKPTGTRRGSHLPVHSPSKHPKWSYLNTSIITHTITPPPPLCTLFSSLH